MRHSRIALRSIRATVFSLLRLAVLIEGRDVGPEVVGLLLVLDAGQDHLGAGDLSPGVLDVLEELFLVPGDAGILVGVGIGIIRRGAGLAAVEPVELGADLVLGAVADRMAGHAFVERGLAGGGVLRQRGSSGGRGSNDDQRTQNEFFHRKLLAGFGGRRCRRRCCTRHSRSTRREAGSGLSRLSLLHWWWLAFRVTHSLVSYPKRSRRA